MDEFAEDARTISKILNFWDFGFFVAALRRYANEPSHKRVQLVLQDYFREKDFVEESLVDDAQVIKGLFPECSAEEINSFLEEVGNEDNRVRLVARRILKRNSALLKRTHSSDVVSDEVAKKKPKIDLAMDDIIIRPSTYTDIIIPDSPDSPSPEQPTKAGFTSPPPPNFTAEEWAKNPCFAAVSDHEEEELLGAGINNEAEPIVVGETEDKGLIYHLMEMFPDACPQYIRNICKGLQNAPGVLDNLISQILDGEYPKRVKSSSPVHQMEAEEQFEMLKEILPDADLTYLQSNFERFIDNPDELKIFIDNALENRSYPKLKDALRKQQISAQQKQYTTEFKVENFLELIPEPTAYFEDPKRKELRMPKLCHFISPQSL